MKKSNKIFSVLSVVLTFILIYNSFVVVIFANGSESELTTEESTSVDDTQEQIETADNLSIDSNEQFVIIETESFPIGYSKESVSSGIYYIKNHFQIIPKRDGLGLPLLQLLHKG